MSPIKQEAYRLQIARNRVDKLERWFLERYQHLIWDWYRSKFLGSSEERTKRLRIAVFQWQSDGLFVETRHSYYDQYDEEFTIPEGYLLDPEGYLAAQAAAQLKEERENQQKILDKEKKDRALLRTLLARYPDEADHSGIEGLL